MGVHPNYPAPAATVLVEGLGLKAEVAAMEQAIALRKRHEELLRICEEMDIDWRSRPQKFDDIMEYVAGRYRLSVAEILGPSRRDYVVHARQEIMYLGREQKRADGITHRYALTYIGRRLNRDHTTVIHGARQHQKRLAGAAAQ